MDLDRERARHALSTILALKEAQAAGNYISYVKGLPATILQCGLGQAMATLLAAADGETDDHKRLFRHVEAWLCRRDAVEAPFQGHDDLMEAIVEAEQDGYLIAQAEALAYLSWLKKFAVAYLNPPEGDAA